MNPVIATIQKLGPANALWVDAAGTLLHPTKPVAQTYAAAAADHNVVVPPREVASRFKAAMRDHRASRLSEPSWRSYWKAVVADATGSSNPHIFEQLYAHYASPRAWSVAPGGRAFIKTMRERGLKVALISNWDDRLRPLLGALGLLSLFDAVLVSGEEGVEKPDRAIFERAADRLQIPTDHAVMIGDSPVSDIEGAGAVGAAVIQIGRDFSTFDELMQALG